MDADLVVIGGGPVGATLAILLARRGRRVTVLEKAELPRDKPCGEGLMPSGARLLAGLGVDLDAAGFPAVDAVRYRLPAGGDVRGRLRLGPGRGVRRTRFDLLLAEHAAGTPGVRFLTGCPALALRTEAEDVRVATPAGELRARVAIGADGMRSAAARWLGWAQPARGTPRHALVGHLAVGGSGTPRDEIVVTLLGDVEVYAAPSADGELLIAVLGARGRLRAPGLSVAETYRAIVGRAHPELAAAPLTGRVWGAGPFSVAPRTVGEGRAFLVGDAAGFLDPLTGDGISAGLAQAAALADLLGAPLDLSDTASVSAAAVRYRRWTRGQWRRRRAVSAMALALTRSRTLAARAVEGVTRRPEALQSLLEVNDGSRALTSLRPADWAALAGF